jgi:acetoacetate decarboxylase
MNSILKVIWNLVFNLSGFDVSFGGKYSDWSFYLIEFKVNYQGVKRFLAERHITPKEIAPGETRLQIVGCDMRDVQIAGSYHEVSIQVPVVPVDGSPGDIFAHLYLPVNTEAARWSGVDIFGFPKFIADIDIEKDGTQVVCRLAADQKRILEFTMDDKVGVMKQLKWEYYGNRKHQLIKTTFDLEGLMFEGGANQHASLVLGKHPIAETLRELFLSDEVVRTLIGHNVSGLLRKPVRMKF